MPIFINQILLAASIFFSFGIVYIIYSRSKEHQATKFYILGMILIVGYIISHGIHFLLIQSSNVTILDQSCHSFLVLILLSFAMFVLEFTSVKNSILLKTSLIIPTLAIIYGIWSNSFILESHKHQGAFEAHYTNFYFLLILWYFFLLLFISYWLQKRYKHSKNYLIKSQVRLIFFTIVVANFIAALFGMVFPWLFGYYTLVEISPISFIIGAITLTTLGISKYNLFPIVTKRINSFSVLKKVIFAAIIIVPIFIILIQIPIGRLILNLNNSDLWRKYFLFSLISGVLVSSILTFVISKIVSTPISKLREQSEEIKNRNFGVTIDYVSSDEIGQLVDTFNSMSLKLLDDQKAIKRNESKIFALIKALENSNVGYCLLNSSLNIIEVNEKFSSIYLSTKTNSKFIENLKKTIPIESYDKIITFLKEKNSFEEEIQIDAKKEKAIHFLLANYIQNTDEQELYILIDMDITKVKLMERKLFNSEKLAELGKMSAIMAHEIKTPLTSIKMNIDILSEEFNFAHTSSMSIINRETERLSKLANEILEYSKTKKLFKSKFFILDLLEEVKKEFSLKNESININLKVNSNFEMFADRDKMQQVFNNLIKNSFESVLNEVSVIITCENFDDSNCIYVEDNGSGISKDMQDVIFNPFITFKTSGTGLGLAIVKQIVEQHNGTITLEESCKGKTVFLLKFAKEI